MPFFIFRTVCISLLFAASASAQQTALSFTPEYHIVHGGIQTAVPESLESMMPRLGVAIAGGGAKAAASVGVLKVLHEEGIPVAAIAGTSMGAGVGGLFAAGYRPDEIERIFLENDWNDIFNDRPARAFLTQEQKVSGSRHLLQFTFKEGRLMPPYGLTGGQKLTNMLASRTLAASFEADLDFNRLKVPFRAVATDIESGEVVVLGRGLLHDAIRASMAIPLVFQPVEIQGRLLVDGGLANNLPVDVVRSMGSEVVIAIDSSAKLEKKERLASLVEIMSQSISLPVRRESERQAALADLVITPDTSDYSFADFPSMAGIIRRGEKAARAALPRIQELMKPRTTVSDSRRFAIISLKISGNGAGTESTLRSDLASLLQHEASAGDIRRALTDIYRRGNFSDVTLALEPEGVAWRALLSVTENPVITTVTFSGNTVLRTEEILPRLVWQNNNRLNSSRLAAALDGIIALYKEQGYLLAKVERTEVQHDGTLAIRFYEGMVDAITLRGHRTSRSLIRRETSTRAGEPLNFRKAAYDVQHLYALDYFEAIGVDMDKSAQGGIDLILRLKEKPTNRIRLGLRYDLEDRFTGLTDVLVDNVGGRGVKLFVNSQYGNYLDFTFGYRSPVVLRTNFLHTVNAFYRKRSYFLYENKHRVRELEITREGLEVSFGYQWFRFGDTYLRYRFASDSTRQTLGIDPPGDTDRIGSWSLLSTIDTRDSNTFATTGRLIRFLAEQARRSYGASKEYSKTFLSGQEHFPAAKRHTIVLEAAIGLGSGSIPYAEQYGIGGADYVTSLPLMGYERREFTGNNLLLLSAAYRYRILDYQLSLTKAVYLNVAYQQANVWNSRDDMSIGNLREGGGVGIHADTIIGPVRLDLSKGQQNRTAVSFSAGFDF